MKLTEEQIKSMADALRKSYLSDMKEALNGENPYEGSDDKAYPEDFGIWLDSPHPEVPEYDKWYNSGDDLGDDYNNIHKAALPSYYDFVSAITGDFPRSKKDGFDFDGIWVDNPYYEETGRFPFDTMQDSINYYGDENADAIKRMYKELAIPEEKVDKTPDDPDESSDKPHDDELAGETTPEEDFMQRAAEGKIPATSSVLAGDLTPEEIEMIQMMRAGKQPPKSKELSGETTPEEKEMLKLAGNQTVSDERMKNITNRLAINLSKHRW